MAFENEIRREDIAYRLCKALEVRGQTPTLQLDTGVAPVVVVADLSQGNSLDYATTRFAAGHGNSPAGAFYPKLSFNNQLESGIIVAIKRIELWAPLGLGGYVTVGIETASAGGTQINFTKSFTDARIKLGTTGFPAAKLPSVDIRFDNSIGLGGGFMKPWAPPTSGSLPPWQMQFGGFVLRPGTRLHFEGQDLGGELQAHVEWTETNI